MLTIDALTMEMRSLAFSSDPERARATSVTAPDPVGFHEISPVEYVKRIEGGWMPFLLDVRRPDEEQIVSIDGTALRIQHLSVPNRMSEIPTEEDVVVYCRTGGRSAAVARFLSESGWPDGSVYNLSGGIHEWSDTIDSEIPKY